MSPAAGAIAVSSPVSPTAGAIAVASPADNAVCAAAAMAAPRASAKAGSSATCTRMVDASRNWSATWASSGEAPTRYTSPGASGRALSWAIIVLNVAVASPPASGSLASTVGGASWSSAEPGTDSVAVASSITSAAPGRPAARIRAVTACDSDSTRDVENAGILQRLP